MSTVTSDGIVRAHTVLYDKRREECYKHIPIVQFIDVSSAVSVRVGSNVLWGQLHRLMGLIMERDNFITEVSERIALLQTCGFQPRSLRKVLVRFVNRFYYNYGDRTSATLLFRILASTGLSLPQRRPR
jgi:hypothetical protein